MHQNWQFMKIKLSQSEAPFKAFQWSDDQIPKLYNTNDRLNVTELLTTIRTSTKQTKKTSKITDLRGRLKTADHCGAVLLFELNSLTYAFCSTSHDFMMKFSIKICEPLFSFLLAAQSVFEFAMLQLKGECFALPSAMICAVVMSRADSGMRMGSSS